MFPPAQMNRRQPKERRGRETLRMKMTMKTISDPKQPPLPPVLFCSPLHSAKSGATVLFPAASSSLSNLPHNLDAIVIFSLQSLELNVPSFLSSSSAIQCFSWSSFVGSVYFISIRNLQRRPPCMSVQFQKQIS